MSPGLATARGDTQPMTQVPSQEVTVPILAKHIDAEDGHCWMTVLPELGSGDTAADPGASQAQLFENGAPLGPAHASHADIRARGGGLFSHWGDVLYFSTSDNADPRTGGREYTIRGPRREGEIPPRHVLGGSEVVPSFTGQSFIDRALLDEMHRHDESSGKSSWGTRNILHAAKGRAGNRRTHRLRQHRHGRRAQGHGIGPALLR